jgi:hypothetical protein
MVCAVSLVLTTASAALLQPPSIGQRGCPIGRRDCVILGAASALSPSVSYAEIAEAQPSARVLSADFGMAAEPGRPYIHYLENAEKLAEHLISFADGVDLSVGDALDAEITAFSATYAPRPGALIDGGPVPGINELKTSYDALAYHLARYRGRKLEPLPEALASTVRRNALAAQKRILKVQEAREAAAGTWPTCRGVPLGSRDTQCSTDDF